MKRDGSEELLLKEENCSTEKNLKFRAIQYDRYIYSFKEMLLVITLITMVIAVISYLFYRSFWSVPFLIPIGVYLWRMIRKMKTEKRKRMLADQFKDCLASVSSSLRAGYSAENAFRESLGDISMIYGSDSYMAMELKGIISGLANKRNLEEMLSDLGERSGISDIREFAEVFRIAKRSGGSMTGIISDTISLMNRKMEIDREIQVLITSKKLESAIMDVIPFAMIAYLSFASPGFFDCLYHNAFGILIMTGCLVLYCLGFCLSRKIIEIEG